MVSKKEIHTENKNADLSLIEQYKKHILQLENELQITKHSLQKTFEELDASNEELRSANDELISSNDELVKLNADLSLQTKRLEVMNSIISISNRIMDIEVVFDNFMKQSMWLLDFEAGGIYLLDEDGATAKVVYHQNLPEEFLEKVGRINVKEGAYQKVFIENQPFVSTDYQVARPNPWGFRSACSVPLLLDGHAVGALNVVSRHKHSFSMEEVSFLMSIGEELAAAINRAKIRRVLKEGEEKYKKLVSSLPDGVLMHVNGRIVYSNDAMQNILQRSNEEVFNARITDFIVEKDIPVVMNNLQRRIAGENVGSYEISLKTKTGTVKVVEVRAVTVDYLNQQAVLSVLTDITEKKKAEDELRKSEEKYKSLVDNLPDVVMVHVDNKIVYVNDNATRITGYTPDEILGKSMFDFIDKEDVPSVMENFGARLSGKSLPSAYEIKIRAKSGEYHNVEIRASMINFKGQNAILAILTNVTEKKKTEKALRESEERLRETIELIPLGIYEFDLNMDINFFNSQALEIFGYGPEAREIKLNAVNMIAAENRTEIKEAINRVFRGEPFKNHEYTGRKKDGSKFPLEINSAVIYRDGKCCGLRGTLQDLTHKKKIEEDLLKASKLESIGVLAAGIAHDFNNILTAILGNISLAKLKINNEEKALAVLDDAEKASLVARELTMQLLTFSKGGELIKENSKLDEIVKNSAQLALIGSKSSVKYRFDKDLWAADVDKGQFSRVIHNLIINASQAMPDGGLIVIEGKNSELIPGEKYGLVHGKYILISIKDSGIGIPEKYIRNIFDPYFTTKQMGSGLGLAICYSIIKKHGGYIDVESKIGEYTIFNVLIPASV